MTQPDNEAVPTNLVELQESLLATARDSSAHRAAHTVYGGGDAMLRQTVMALLAGAELGEHEAPPEATLQVLTGRVRLSAGERSWELSTGDLVPIPGERHSLAALDDSVVMLSVLRAASQ